MAKYNYVQPRILGNISGYFDFYCGSTEQFRFTWRISEQDWNKKTTDIEWRLEGKLTDAAQPGDYSNFEGMGYHIKNYTDDYPYDTYVTTKGLSFGSEDNFQLKAGEDWKLILEGTHKLTGALTPARTSVSSGMVTFQPNFFTVKFWWGMNSSNSYTTNVSYRPCLPWAYITNAPVAMYDTQTIEVEYYVPCVNWDADNGDLYLQIFGYDYRGVDVLTRFEQCELPSKIGFYKVQSEFSTLDDWEYNVIQSIMGDRTSASGYLRLTTVDSTPDFDAEFQSALQPSYTYSFDNGQRHTQSIVINLADNAPTINAVIEDINPVSLALTGDKSKLILNVSNVKVTANAEGQKGGVIEKVTITHKGVEYETDERTFEAVTENLFRIYAEDNRKVVSVKDYKPECVSYVPTTAKIKSNSASGTGEMVLKVDGLFWDGNFGVKTNSLKVYYRLRKASETDFSGWAQFGTVTYNEKNGTYEASQQLTGLDYMATYVYQAYAEDAVGKYYAPELVLATTPVFDWGQRDFNFNVPVTIQGSKAATQTDLSDLRTELTPKPGNVLWQGEAIMNENDTIVLSESISSQNTGILLVFGDNADYSAVGGPILHSYFLPKQWVTCGLFDDCYNHCHIVESSNIVRSKTLKFTDTTVTGHTWNDANGYTNWKLKYIVGV